MFKLVKIESKIQEILFLMTVIVSSSLILSSSMFLAFSSKQLVPISGNVGTQFLFDLFNIFGYAALYVGISLYVIGSNLVERVTGFRDLLNSHKFIIFHLLLQFSIILVLSSSLSVLQGYLGFANNAKMASGAGGGLGILVGSTLFTSFGLYGAFMVLIGFILSAGIVSGYLDLVNSILLADEYLRVGYKKSKVIIVDLSSRALELLGLDMSDNSPGLSASPDLQIAGSDMLAIQHELPKEIRHNIQTGPSNFLQKVAVAPVGVVNANARQARINKKYMEAKNASETKAAKILEKAAKKAAKSVSKKSTKTSAKKKASSEQPPEFTASEDLPTSEGSTDAILVKKFTKKYKKPDAGLLAKPEKASKMTQKELDARCAELEERLKSFNISGQVKKAHCGDRLTMFEFLPDAGVKTSKISALANDLALVLGAPSIRILAPIPGRTTVGIEVPNKDSRLISFSEMLKSVQSPKKKMDLPVAMGRDVYGDVVVQDIAAMPHVLVSGTTGSGKSVFVNTVITSLLYTQSPKNLRFIMIDPKMIELSPYNGIPHLLKPVVTDLTEAKDALVWAEQEMDRRYEQFAETGARNIESFNEKIRTTSKTALERRAKKKFDWDFVEMPKIVIVVDELADLMITQGKDVEIPITRIAQKARACGIHLIIATQRPSAEIVTGLIKTNFPTRVAFKVSSSIDSRTILDQSGAEKLLGHGDMLYMPNGKTVERVQGCFVSEKEVRKIVSAVSE